MSSLSRRCVFCGGIAVRPSREHVIPRWLNALGGDMRRTARLTSGFFRSGIAFPLDNLTCTACVRCNSQNSLVEDRASRIVKALLQTRTIKRVDMPLLLDWLDRLRLGVWWSALQITSNPAGVDPHFAINGRIGLSDRLTYFFHTNAPSKLLGLPPLDDIVFHHSPSIFYIYINGIAIVSLATHCCGHELALKSRYRARRHGTNGVEISGPERNQPDVCARRWQLWPERGVVVLCARPPFVWSREPVFPNGWAVPLQSMLFVSQGRRFVRMRSILRLEDESAFMDSYECRHAAVLFHARVRQWLIKWVRHTYEIDTSGLRKSWELESWAAMMYQQTRRWSPERLRQVEIAMARAMVADTTGIVPLVDRRRAAEFLGLGGAQ